MTTVAVIGDLFGDVICDLTGDLDCPPALARGDGYEGVSTIAEDPGGGAVQFAIAATKYLPGEITVIGKVGQGDATAPQAINLLTKHGIGTALAVDPLLPTGRAVITYLPGNRRFMVSDTGANGSLNLKDVTAAMTDTVARARLVYASGYTLVQPGRRSATMSLLRTAREHGADVALDLVPHELDRYVEPTSLLDEAIELSTWIFAVESTARRLLGRHEASTAQLLHDLCGADRNGALLPNPWTALIRADQRVVSRTFDYETGVRSRGQSAAVQARILGEFA
ncbi:carbohydrate kinase family protein [Streptomyces sp. MAR4 CNY-716]